MSVHYPTQDWFGLVESGALDAATYTYELPPIRAHRGVSILLSVTVSGASGTVDGKLQYKHPISLAWTDFPNATFVQFGAGATGEKFITVYPGLTGSDADASVAVATAFKMLGLFPLRTMRFSVTVGTGAVTLSAGGYLLP
jgi:hypothetical protein